MKTILKLLKTIFTSHKVVTLWISIVVYHWIEGKTVSFIAHQMWRQSVEEIQCFLRAQLGKSGAAAGKVQLGRAGNWNRTCDCWEMCSWWLGHWPLQCFHSRYLSEIESCSSVTALWFLCPSSLSPGTSLSCASPTATQWLLGSVPALLCIDKAGFKTWMAAQECQMYSQSRNRI